MQAPTLRKLTGQEAAYARDFTASVAAGDDRKLPIYRVDGKLPRMVPVSEFLGECHKDAQALLFKACAAAFREDGAMALELLRSFVEEIAAEYGVTTNETVELISDVREAA